MNKFNSIIDLLNLHTNIDPVTDCWLYTRGFIIKDNLHAKIRCDGKDIYVHRLSAKIHWGFDLDSSTLILHKCANANCWNPKHLCEGTRSDNQKDSIKVGTHKAPGRNKYICNCGHALDGLRGNGKRYCKTCNRNRHGYK